jgi:transcriptional regulator with XRE-family HTH domain
MSGMTTRQDDLSQFLKSRRARLVPADVGLTAARNGRRVSGLRREELAMLAGVSPDYYARLEQGRAVNVSGQVLEAVAVALRLDELERRHLATLVKPHADAGVNGSLRVRPALRAMVGALDPTPAVLHGPRLEVLAINRAAAVLIHDFDAMPESERNMVRWIFLDPNAHLVYPDWPEIAAQLVAILRVAAGRDTTDARLAEVVAELSEASPEFARSWADRNLFQHTYGPKRIHHKAIGTITVNYETMHLAADPGLSLIVYTADPGSPSEAKLCELVGR